MSDESQLTPQEVVAAWFEEDVDHAGAVKMGIECIKRLTDAGFVILDQRESWVGNPNWPAPTLKTSER